MGRKPKYTAEQKLWAVHQYLNHMMFASSIASVLNVSGTGCDCIHTWDQQYKCNGVDAFKPRLSNGSYTKEFIELVCLEYLTVRILLKSLLHCKANSIKIIQEEYITINVDFPYRYHSIVNRQTSPFIICLSNCDLASSSHG